MARSQKWEGSEVARSEKWEGSEVAMWGRWESSEVARWEVSGFIQGCEMQVESKHGSAHV